MRLTADGEEWARTHAATSLVAVVALNGFKWPVAHRETAIRYANTQGAGMSEPVVRDPEAWAAVAKAGR